MVKRLSDMPEVEAMHLRRIECQTYDDFVSALKKVRSASRTTVIHIRNDRYAGVGGYESWWDVPPAEVSEMDGVRQARAAWEAQRPKERLFF